MASREQQFQDAQLRRQFAQAFASGSIKAIDRIGQPIETGALVMYRPPFDLIYEVHDVKPVLDPRQPVGVVQAVLSCSVPVLLQVNTPVMAMIRVGTQQAPGQASLDPLQAQPTPPSPLVVTDADAPVMAGTTDIPIEPETDDHDRDPDPTQH